MSELEKALLQISVSVAASLAIFYATKWLLGPRLKILPHDANFASYQTRKSSILVHR